jgi:hypothetical protein
MAAAALAGATPISLTAPVVVHSSRIGARLAHVGEGLRRQGRLQPLVEGSGAIVEIPVEGLGGHGALRVFDADGEHVSNEEDHVGKPHAGVRQAEFLSLLQAVCEIGARIGKGDHIGTASLRAKQQGSEVRGAKEWIGRLAKDLAAGLNNEVLGVSRERMAERVVGGDEIPFVATILSERGCSRVGDAPGVVGPVDLCAAGAVYWYLYVARPGSAICRWNRATPCA